MELRQEVTNLAGVTMVVGVMAAVTRFTSAHSIDFGRCNKVPGDPYFHPDELTGLWYVIEMFKTSSQCMTLTFQRTADGFVGTEVRELLMGSRVGLDHTVSNTGVFTFKYMANPALMRVRWPSVFISKPAEVTVVDTDGTHFAVLYECQSLWVFRRASAVILSRSPTLDDGVLQRIKEDLEKMNISVEHFSKINHADCKTLGEAEVNFDLNDIVGIMKQQWPRGRRARVTKAPPARSSTKH
ncbi:Apolipoprotein D [Chionoecetes opilio]|uniref:Apolipoprotein D n=1 Tax=Chionoecetes opilio TaxID=41210 RepID=A0A8J8WCX5_CHIOP|nr:Apolipoprotein D [Chionoecetes opilio]